MRPRTAYFLLAISALAWCAGFILAPVLASQGLDTSLLYALYGRVCHQIPGRSFASGVSHWAVCIRCSSIYLAFLCTAITMPFIKPLARWAPPGRGSIALLLLPLVVDGVADLLGLHGATAVSRVVTGTLAGAGLGLIVVPLWIDALPRSLNRSLRSEGVVHG